jgi:hypothetical protein
MKTVPGPVNLHTNPSPEDRPEMMPPEATRSRIYFVFQATRWPLSTIYLSPSTSYFSLAQFTSILEEERVKELTSFRIIAPKLVIHNNPFPLIL